MSILGKCTGADIVKNAQYASKSTTLRHSREVVDTVMLWNAPPKINAASSNGIA